MVKCLEDSKEALRSFAFREDVEFPFKSILLDIGFWLAITQLLELLEPIHSLQKMSKDNKATISYVYPRWTRLELHLKKIANSNNMFAIDIKNYLTTIPVNGIKLTGIDKKNWTRRCTKQLLPIHRIAYFLDPINSKATISEIELAEVNTYFKHHISDHYRAFEQFFDF